MNVWVSRYRNRSTRTTILHAFGEVDAGPAQEFSFCGRVAVVKTERTKGETYPAAKFGSSVDHCISCERTVRRRGLR